VDELDWGQGHGVLAVPDFRRLWVVGLALSVARWLEMLVIGVVVFQQTGSAFLVATMTLLRLMPLGLFGALIGVLADRVPRQRALLGVLALQAAAVGALSAFALADALAVWQLALASFLSGAGWAADNPVRRMMIGEAVGSSRMSAAMSLDVMASNASRIAGPAVGGTMLALLGAGMAFGLSALLYLGAVVVALGLRCGMAASAPARRDPVLLELRESFRLVRRVPALRGVLVVTVIFNLFGWPCASMIPVIGQASLGLGAEGVGILASMEGVGALAGAALVGALAKPGSYARIYVGGTGLYMAMNLAFAVAPQPLQAGLALLAGGIGAAGFASMQATLTYLSTAREARGRALGLLATAIGTGLLGFLQLGLLAEWLGAPMATVVVSAEGLLALVATGRLWRPLLSRLPDSPT
jgi:MFS family permease